ISAPAKQEKESEIKKQKEELNSEFSVPLKLANSSPKSNNKARILSGIVCPGTFLRYPGEVDSRNGTC
ncbi:hypothetical protein CEXT_651621, partial [Caerostris extrusa]